MKKQIVLNYVTNKDGYNKGRVMTLPSVFDIEVGLLKRDEMTISFWDTNDVFLGQIEIGLPIEISNQLKKYNDNLLAKLENLIVFDISFDIAYYLANGEFLKTEPAAIDKIYVGNTVLINEIQLQWFDCLSNYLSLAANVAKDQ